MNDEEMKEYLKQVKSRGNVLGLTAMNQLMDQLGRPDHSLKIIHIGGTNGKGSVSSYIASVLCQAGYSVGRYISPVVFSQSEMIQKQTKDQTTLITEQEYHRFLQEIQTATDQIEKRGGALPTMFEVETAMSFLAFRDWKVDFAIVEVGMGGRLDATNVIDKVELSVMTPISMDHMNFLGNTLKEITIEKAGIFKNGPVFTMQKWEKVKEVLLAQALEQSLPIHFVSQNEIKQQSFALETTKFQYKNADYEITLIGKHQVENAALAIEVLEYLGTYHTITKNHIQDGIRLTKWPGRFEIIDHNPLVILDGAHNIDGANSLVTTIELYLQDKTIHGIMGMYADKDYAGVASKVVPLLQSVTTISTKGERGLSTKILAVECEKYSSQVYQEEEVNLAVKSVKDRASQKDVILIFGSLSFMAEVNR